MVILLREAKVIPACRQAGGGGSRKARPLLQLQGSGSDNSTAIAVTLTRLVLLCMLIFPMVISRPSNNPLLTVYSLGTPPARSYSPGEKLVHVPFAHPQMMDHGWKGESAHTGQGGTG